MEGRWKFSCSCEGEGSGWAFRRGSQVLPRKPRWRARHHSQPCPTGKLLTHPNAVLPTTSSVIRPSCLQMSTGSPVSA